MLAKIGEFPHSRIVSTRVDENLFQALNQAATHSNFNQAELVRRSIRQYLATNVETPAA